MKSHRIKTSCIKYLLRRLRFHRKRIFVIGGAVFILTQLFLFQAQMTKFEMSELQLEERNNNNITQDNQPNNIYDNQQERAIAKPDVHPESHQRGNLSLSHPGVISNQQKKTILKHDDHIKSHEQAQQRKPLSSHLDGNSHQQNISKHDAHQKPQNNAKLKKLSLSHVDDVNSNHNNNSSKHSGHKNSLDKPHHKKTSLSPLDVIKAYHAKAIRFRHRFNCPAIINGSQTAIREVREFLLHDRPPEGYPLSDPVVSSHMFQDCDSYKRIRKYVLEAGTPEEERFPLAYVILAHQDFDHLERLLRIFYRPQHVFCIHLDDKVGADLKKAVHGLASCFPNVRMASKPQTVTYATMSRLMGDYVCMKDLVTDNKPWKYLVNMAATSLPIQTNKQIIRKLKTMKGQNDITMRYATRIPRRWEVEYFIGHQGYIWPSKTKHAPPPHNITVIKGMAYNTYSREFLDWTMKDQRAIDLLEWSSKTYSPDEHYWATLNNMYHNPHLKAPGGYTENPDLYHDGTFTAKFNRDGQKCEGKSIHRVCLLEVGELTFLKAHPWYRTANKFDLTYDPVAYTCIEESIENRTATGAPWRYNRLG